MQRVAMTNPRETLDVSFTSELNWLKAEELGLSYNCHMPVSHWLGEDPERINYLALSGFQRMSGKWT